MVQICIQHLLAEASAGQDAAEAHVRLPPSACKQSLGMQPLPHLVYGVKYACVRGSVQLYLLAVQAWPWLPAKQGLGRVYNSSLGQLYGKATRTPLCAPLAQARLCTPLGPRDTILAVVIAHSPYIGQRSTLRRQRSSERRMPRMRWRTQKISLLRRRELAALLPSRQMALSKRPLRRMRLLPGQEG